MLPIILRSSELNEVLSKLKIQVDKMFEWFQNNYFKSNPENCHLLTTSKSERVIEISGDLIKSENRTKLLGVYIEGRLNFAKKQVKSHMHYQGYLNTWT